MKNLTIALLSAAALSPAALAHNGFYVGLNGGVANSNAKYDYNSPRPDGAEFNRSNRFDSGKVAGLVGLFSGYGVTLNQGFYVGSEVYGGLDTTSFSPVDESKSGISANFFKTTVKRQYFYGLAARLGHYITPSTLAYVRLAAESGKLRANINPNLDALDLNSPEAKPTTKNKTGVQFSPGVGLEVSLNKTVFVRMEYAYVFGPKISLTQDTTAAGDGSFGPALQHNFKINQHSVKIGVGYRF